MARRMSKAAAARFIAELENGAKVEDAAANAGHHKATFYRLRDRDPEFAAAWDIAYEEGADYLESEAVRRAYDGVEDVKWVGPADGGREVPFRAYSDRLLELLLKARRPSRFRENQRVEHTGPNGGPIRSEVALTDADARDALRGLAAAGLVRPGDAAAADPEG